MKLASLINLKPLKEGAFGMSAKDLAATYSLERLQSIRDELMGDMEQEAEPEGGRIADMYADQLHGLDQAIALKQPTKDVPYDVAVGKMTQDEYDEYMSTVKPDRASFEKSSKFDRMNESEDKWNAIDVSRKAEKEVDNKEWNSRTTAKLDMLIALNAAGKFKKDFDEERLQGWVDQNYSWEKLSRQFKVNEGSCGYGPNGVPGDTPGETQGMNADDRTKGMMRKLIQKEIKKIAEEGSLDDKLKGAFSPEEWDKITSKPVPSFADIKPKPSKDKK